MVTRLDPRQWAYNQWWTAPADTPAGSGPVPLDPQPPVPPQDEYGNATGLPDGY